MKRADRPRKFTVSIELGNDDCQLYMQLAGTLASLANELQHREDRPLLGEGEMIRDSNGNTVGVWKVRRGSPTRKERFR